MIGKAYYRMTLGTHNSLCHTFLQSHWLPCDPAVTAPDDSTEIVTYVEGRETTHLSLEDNPAVHVMSSLIFGSPLCSACCSALSGRGIQTGDAMYVAGQKLSAILSTLRPTRF